MKNWVYIFILILLPFIATGQIIDPSELAGMQLWLRSDTGVVLDVNQTVQTWQDISGQGRDATNANTTMRPFYPQNAIGPYPAVRFDGVNDFLSFDEINNVRTVFWVVSEDPTATNSFRPLLGHPTIADFLRADNGSFWRNTGDPATSANVFVRNGVTRLNQLEINGSTTQVPDQYALVSLVTTGDVVASSFSRSLFGGWVWKGDLIELIVYDSPLTDEQVQGVENYLRMRYAPPVNLGPDINQEYGLCVELLPDWNYTDYNWSNGAQSASTIVQESGTYNLTATDIFGFNSVDSVDVIVPYQTFADSTICLGEEIEWNTGLDDYYNVEWNTGGTTPVLTINQSGAYFGVITDTLFCVLQTDTFSVFVDSYSTEVELGPSELLCAGNELELIGGQGQAMSYLWNDGSMEQTLPVTESGQYWLEVLNANGCLGQDTIDITIVGVAPEVLYSLDQFCENSPAVLNDLSSTSDGSEIISNRWILQADTLWGEEITVEFEVYGDYPISLLVETNVGCSAQINDIITIHPLPLVDFNHSVACTDQLTLFEEDASIPLGTIVSYDWNFGNGTVSQEIQPVVEYDTYGLVTVSLTLVSDQGCDSTYSESLFVNATPNAEFNWGPTCVGTPMEFENQVDALLSPVVVHTWNFGSGLNSSLENPDFLFAGSGSFLVKHFIHAIVEGQSACFNEYEELVLVSPEPQLVIDNTAACVGQELTLTNASIPGDGDVLLSQNWYLNGTNLGDAEQVGWLPDEAGSVEVELQIETAAGCASSLTETILVGTILEPQFSFTPEIGLPPLEVQFFNDNVGSFWFWVFGNEGESFEQEPIYTFLDTGVYQISLFVVDAAGCVGEGTDEIAVVQPIFDASIEQVSCQQIGSQIHINGVIGNYGNHNLRSADITYWLANGTQITDHWDGVLARNSLAEYSFQSALNFNETINPDYLCVEIGNLNGGGEDYDLTNNLICKSFSLESFEVFDAYPVPATSDLWLNFHLKAQGNVEFRMYQLDGKLVHFESNNYPSGYNQVQFNVTGMSAGMYIIEVVHSENVITKKVLISNILE